MSFQHFAVIKKHYKALTTSALGIGIFIVCAIPLRPLLNWHEEQHLFRWSRAYFIEQLSAKDGIWEYIVSFFTQFFHIGWLGALIMALSAIGVQWLTWKLLKFCIRQHPIAYLLSLLPPILLFIFGFIPSSYRKDAKFREAVTYDYLVREQAWDKIIHHAEKHAPTELHSFWCLNYALAMRGELTERLFHFPQPSPDGLLQDGHHVESLPLFALSDIFFELGFINDAERIAFDAKQLLPDNHKSGRAYQRLAECNLINGDTLIAKKYEHFLQSTLFYNSLDKDYAKYQQKRLVTDSLITPALPHKLHALLNDNPQNHLAEDYLLAYHLLRMDYQSVLDTELEIQRRTPRIAPRPVEECVIGNWVYTHPNDSFPITLRQDVFNTTMEYLNIVNQTGNPLAPTLFEPPYSQSYWHYHALSQEKIRQKP